MSYYSDSQITLHHGDALAVLPTLRAGSVRAVILDPPYAMAPVSVRGIDDGAAGASGSPVRLLNESIREAQRLLVVGGVAAVICDWRRVPDVSYLITLAGLRLTSCVAWTRTTIGTGGMFRSAWDPILVASKGAPDLIDKAGIPNVVHANPPRDKEHPYEKPPLIWQHILKRLPPGEVVDPFAGSAASAEAARTTGHSWTGIEVGEDRLARVRPRRRGARGDERVRFLHSLSTVPTGEFHAQRQGFPPSRVCAPYRRPAVCAVLTADTDTSRPRRRCNANAGASPTGRTPSD